MGRFYNKCKECVKEDSALYREKNPEKRRLAEKEWRKRNYEKAITYQRRWVKEHKDRIPDYAKKHNEKNKKLVLDAYGVNGIHECACCGEGTIEFLSIDHKNGGGNKHRRELQSNGKGGNFYRWLRKEGFPQGYQILCYNCNLAKGFYGKCPHTKRVGDR